MQQEVDVMKYCWIDKTAREISSKHHCTRTTNGQPSGKGPTQTSVCSMKILFLKNEFHTTNIPKVLQMIWTKRLNPHTSNQNHSPWQQESRADWKPGRRKYNQQTNPIQIGVEKAKMSRKLREQFIPSKEINV